MEARDPKEALAHELLVLAVGVGLPGAQKQWSRMILGSWASCSYWA